MDFALEKAKAALKSLSRIRAGEQREADGGKSVWHQGAKGADLLSYVDSTGRVTEQAFTLLSDHFIWKEKTGLRSGTTTSAGSSVGAWSQDNISMDSELSAERVRACASVLSGYSGEDKYILHFKKVVERFCKGLEMLWGDEVTGKRS
jgi:hypothetical protein